MDDITQTQLKVVVERAVRPVRATMARKRQMREELLSHLVAVFEDELEKTGDAQAALERAKQRFGDLGELTTQFQQAVPRWDRCRSILENMCRQPGESVWHLAAKQFLVVFVIYAVTLLGVKPMELLLDMLWYGASVQYPPGALVVGLVMVLFNVVFSLFFVLLLNRIGPLLVGKRRGRILLAVLCSLMLPLVFSYVITGAAVVFILMARQATQEWRCQADWAITGR